MSSSLLLTLALVAAPPLEAGGPAASMTTPEIATVRGAYRDALRMSSGRPAHSDLIESVPKLVAVYRAIGSGVAGLSHAEGARMRRAIEKRLIDTRDRLARESARLQRLPRTATSPTILPGGAASNDFDRLIELIQNTIDPDSWDDAFVVGFGPLAAPAPLGGFGGAGANAAGNTGSLIDLIKESTTQESWDIYGGPGTISPIGF